MDVESIVASVKSLKEAKVADRSIEVHLHAFDLTPTVVFWRAGREVARVHCRDVDRDQGLKAVRLGVPAYGADTVVFVSDAYRVTRKWFRDRGREPRPGELQRLFERGRTDLVQEGLSVTWADRTGGVYGLEVPYVIDVETRTVRWEYVDRDPQPPELMTGEGIAGRVPDALRTSFATEQTLVRVYSLGIRPEDYDLTDAQARIHFDVSVSQMLIRRGYAVGVACYSEEESAILKRALDADPDVSYYGVSASGKAVTKNWPPPDQ